MGNRELVRPGGQEARKAATHSSKPLPAQPGHFMLMCWEWDFVR